MTGHRAREAAVSRRDFGRILGGAAAAAAFGACVGGSASTAAHGARLTARPRAGVKTSVIGEQRLGLGGDRDGLLQVPAVDPATPIPLMILFHGAASSGQIQLRRFAAIPADAGVAVVAVDSRGNTWDAIRGTFGPDVEFIDRVLDHVFEIVNVDPARLTMAGFSDGATYALSLGLVNADLFPRLAGFSAGFLIDGPAHGTPRVFMSHGTDDDILPIDQCGRRVAAELRQLGCDVTFREFKGKHEVPPDVVREACGWIAAK